MTNGFATLFFPSFLRAHGSGYAKGDFDSCKRLLMERADAFLEKSATSRQSIAKTVVERFIRDECVVLVHGLSRVILAVLEQASNCGKRMTVYVTEARTPARNFGWEMAKRLTDIGLSVQV